MYLRWSFALLSWALLATSCGGDSDNCPDICPMDSIHPTMTIEVADGTASIASAEVGNGPCASLLIHSAGEVGVPTGYAAVQVTYNGSTSSPPPLCVIKVTSLAGDSTSVTTQPTLGTYEQPCCPYGSCCSKTSVISLHPRVTYDQPVQTFSFPSRPDGGTVDVLVDVPAPIEDGVIDGAQGAIDDASEIDGGLVDAGNEVDGWFIDASGNKAPDAGVLVDAAIDS
ncbi:MAG TPA: hypothetical protein VIM14_01565 [Polyangia bacterium]